MEGLPTFVPPRDWKNSKGADPRSDLYSLGCAFYFLLSGQVPFPRAGAIEKILAHQTETPAPIQVLQPRVPSEVAQIVHRLLAKNPDDRIQTAGELAALLASHSAYPEDASPVEIVVHDSDAQEVTPTKSNRAEAAGAPSSVSMPGPLTLLELEEGDKPYKSHKPVSPSERTPRPRSEVADSTARPPGRRPKPKQPVQKSRTKERTTQAPQWVWCIIALLGVAVLALMLWIVSTR